MKDVVPRLGSGTSPSLVHFITETGFENEIKHCIGPFGVHTGDHMNRGVGDLVP